MHHAPERAGCLGVTAIIVMWTVGALVNLAIIAGLIWFAIWAVHHFFG